MQCKCMSHAFQTKQSQKDYSESYIIFYTLYDEGTMWHAMMYALSALLESHVHKGKKQR